MHLELLRSGPALGLLCIDLVLAASFVVLPLRRRYDDDQGDGRALVLLPEPRKVWQGRTLAFVLVFLALDIAHIEPIGRALDSGYGHLLARFAGSVLRAPVQIGSSLTGFALGLRYLVVATIFALGLTVQAPLVRRIIILLQAGWYLALVFCVDSMCIVLNVLLHVPVAPAAITGQFIALVIGLVTLLRMVFVNFALPRGTELPFRRRSGSHHSALMLTIATSAFVIAGAGAIALIKAAPARYQSALAVILPLSLFGIAMLLRTSALHLIRMAGPRDPEVGDLRPPVDVIIPAYNEEEWIAETLVAIDVAAGRYGGPVRAIMTDDGSTDRTEQIATEVMGKFRHASGTVVKGHHGGKSAALNMALAESRSDIVIRIDADTTIDEWSIYYSVRWFRDPSLGQVQAMVIPKQKRSIFAKMRLFECLQRFGFVHRAIQVVDAVNVVPGMFTAFRREPLVELGGFTLGMNGEDADMTLNFSRLGYRTWLDPNVVIYEDVPPTYKEFRQQRIRWSRASLHVFARHAPFRVGGFGTPKVWFTQTQLAVGKLTVPIKLTSIVYVLVIVFLVPSDRVLALRIGAAFLLAYVVAAGVSLVLAGRFGVVKRVPWVVFWGPFVLLRLVFGLEALLSLPPRPVHVPGLTAAPRIITQPVIH
ncbi:MAG: glycosyltransferase family 2 protein [Acidimicrobiales bacterium]